MIDWIIETLKANTHLVIFLTLAIGYWAGNFKIGKFALGSVTGTLLAGVLIGQLGFDISPQVKTMFFTMFLFAVGYSVGPQFVQGVAQDGLPQAIFGVVVSLLCLASVYIARQDRRLRRRPRGRPAGRVRRPSRRRSALPPTRSTPAASRMPRRCSTRYPSPMPSPTCSAPSAPASSCRCSAQAPQRRPRQGVQGSTKPQMAKGTPAGGMGIGMAAVADARLPGQGEWPGGRQDGRGTRGDGQGIAACSSSACAATARSSTSMPTPCSRPATSA